MKNTPTTHVSRRQNIPLNIFLMRFWESVKMRLATNLKTIFRNCVLTLQKASNPALGIFQA